MHYLILYAIVRQLLLLILNTLSLHVYYNFFLLKCKFACCYSNKHIILYVLLDISVYMYACIYYALMLALLKSLFHNSFVSMKPH